MIGSMRTVILKSCQNCGHPTLLIGHYCEAHKKENAPLVITLDGIGSASSKSEVLPKQDSRLESFVFYLLRNDETKNMPLVELAVLEQFSFPGLDMNTQLTSAFRNAADALLQSRRNKHQEADTLKQWHQAYHFFRRSVYRNAHYVLSQFTVVPKESKSQFIVMSAMSKSQFTVMPTMSKKVNLP